MIKHIWSLLCEDSSVDQETNKLSLRNVLESIEIKVQGNLPEKMVIPISFEIVSFFTRADASTDEELHFKARLVNAEMDQLGKDFPVDIKFPAKSNRLRSRLKIQGLPIKGEGKYAFIISIKTSKEKEYKTVAELPLEIKFVK